MEYALIGLLAWFGIAVLTAIGWSAFYTRIGRDHPALDGAAGDRGAPPGRGHDRLPLRRAAG